MKIFNHFSAILLLGLLSCSAAMAQVVFSDGFESYNLGGLDKDYPGPNAAPNGSGNPWFGPYPPNLRVVGTEGSIIPHSGNQMARGANTGSADYDQDWVNIGYRFNGGSPFSGNVRLDWWFYDLQGAGDGNYSDYAALGYYDTAPNGTDYPGTGSLNTGVSKIQRLSLGAYTFTGADLSKYQVRVVGASDSVLNGWFNTGTSRSAGWHHGRIVVGQALGDGTADVSFYIDDMLNPTFSHNSATSYGFNVIELNAEFGAETGYYDDVSLSVVPEPAIGSLLVLGGLGCMWLRRRMQ